MIPLVVITHGGIGRELLLTASIILGERKADGPAEFMEITSASGIDEIRRKLSEKVESFSRLEGYEGTLVLTDMLGGSSCNVCLPLVKNHKLVIISGVNLYMVLSALKNRSAQQEKITLDELKKRVISDGIKSIADVCSIFIK